MFIYNRYGNFPRKNFFMEYNTVHLYNKLFFFLKKYYIHLSISMLS